MILFICGAAVIVIGAVAWVKGMNRLKLRRRDNAIVQRILDAHRRRD